MPETPAPIPPEALAVLQKFLDASLKRDTATMKSCLSKATLESGNFNEAGQEGVHYIIGEPHSEGESWVVPVKAVPDGAPDDTPGAMELPAILILEDGAWKFDLATTMDRLMGGAMQTAMQQVGDAMGQAMEGIGNALSEALGGTSAAPPKPWREADTAYAPEELFPIPDSIPLPKLESALSAICRHPVRATVAMADLLKQVYSDDSKTMLDWLDDTLLAPWISMVALLANRYPYIRRLTGLRLEPAKESEQRMLILDGSDLVYRMEVNRNIGYYSDDYINEILPALLAALPESPDPQLEGKRTIHLDTEDADLELFKSRAVPRQMRRICELLGKEITLDVNWDDTYDAKNDTRQFLRWSLNRIYGALCFVCLDPRKKTQFQAEFQGIAVKLGLNISDRAAEYKDGILTICINFFPGEIGCFYEKDLVRVLEGEVIKVVEPPEEAASEEAAAESASEDEDDASADEASAGGEEESDDDQTDEDDEENDDKDGEEEQDTGDEEDNDEEALPLDDAARARKLNDDNFRQAAESIKANEPVWAMQLGYIFNHPTAVELDFDSLGGDFSLVQPFMHQGLTGAITSLPPVVMDKILPPALIQACQKLIIAGTTGDACTAAFDGTVLRISVPLKRGDFPPPAPAITNAWRALAGLAPQAPAPAQAVANAPVHSSYGTPEPDYDYPDQDRYARAATFMRDLENALKENKMWPGDQPEGEIEVRGAFGCENMAFTQWLAWILIPRVNDIIQSRGNFPQQSQVSTYAVREFDGYDQASPALDVLIAFDNWINKESN